MADGYEVGHGKPPKHGQIKKGEVRNPKGAGSHTNRVTPGMLKRLSQADIQEIGTMLLCGDLPALKKIIDEREEKTHSVLKVWIASVVYRAIIKGEIGPLEVLLNRFVGKVPDKIEFPSGSEEDPSMIRIELVSAAKKE